MKIQAFVATMPRTVGCTVLIMLLACAGVAAPPQSTPLVWGHHQVHPSRILAKFKPQFSPTDSSNILAGANSKLGQRYKTLPQLAVLEDLAGTVDGTEETKRTRLEQRIAQLQNTGIFEYVEPDYWVQPALSPTDEAFTDGRLWGLRNTGQNGGLAGADISAEEAWDLTTGSTNVVVAVIDTGVRYTHLDLASQMWINPGEIPDNGIDDDGDGYIDNIHGIDAIVNSGDPFDMGDHGTHVAGTIGAAANDGNPHVGVAWKVQIMALKFLGPFGGSTSDGIECIDFAVSKGVRILNNSWGGGGYSQALYDSIERARQAGVLFVAAAGNEANNNDLNPAYPASYPIDNIISVAALTRNDSLADFSNYGATSVHIGAPGASIFSSYSGSDTEYATIAGTSMAAPHVSGVAALILSLYPTADLTELRQRILLGAVPTPSLTGRATTGARLDAYNALTVSGSGILQMTIDPPNGAAILAGSTQPIFVRVTDLFGIPFANVTGTVSGGGTLTFLNNGTVPDVIANDATYSANYTVPGLTNPVTITLVASATNKVSVTNVITYHVLPPPVNDHFANATKAPAAGAVYLSNNRFATMEPGEPSHGGISNVSASLWWSWTATGNTNVFVDTTGSAIDTILSVYAGNSLGSLTLVANTNDIGAKKQAHLSFAAVGGMTYRIAVASAVTNSLGSLRLRIAPGGQVDTTLPQVAFTSPLSGTAVTGNLITVTGTATDPAPNNSGVAEVLVSVNGAIGITAAGNTNWSSPALLRLGLNTIQAVALDLFGNASSPATIQVVYLADDPVNDIFASAINLAGHAGVSSISTTNATKQNGEPNHAGNAGGKSAWWCYTAPADGLLTLGTTNSNFDTLLAVYTGTQVNALTNVAANDDAFAGVPGGFSALSVAVRAGQMYRIAVDGYDGLSGEVQLSYLFEAAQVYRLTVSTSGPGNVNPGSMDVVAGQQILLTAVPGAAATFDLWGGDILSLVNPVVVQVSGNHTVTASFLPEAFTDGFESGDFTGLGWTTGGNLPWIVQNTNTASGTFAARSGVIGASQTSSLFLSRNFRAGLGSFSLRVSSESTWDVFAFYVDGVLQQQWSGELGWSSFGFPLTAGTHTLEWRYSKDVNNSAGLDAAFIDNVNLPIVVPVNATTPAQLTARRQSDGLVFLDILGQTNQFYIIQVSTNLVNWQPLSTIVTVNGSGHVLDPGSLTNSVRFFRAMTPNP